MLFVCVLALAPGTARSQTTGRLSGRVTDPTGSPLAGVSIEAVSSNLQGKRDGLTGPDGTYRFPAVPPGSYRVQASLSGFSSAERTVMVPLDGAVTADLTLRLEAQERLVVSGEAPLVEKTSTTTGTNYGAETIKGLPVDRNYASIVLSQPGVQTDNGVTQGRALAISVYGSTSAENLWLIDGVNTTSVIYGVQGKDINSEFIEEVEVKTGGYQAEYGRNTGGVINVVTKSGGNVFHGGVFGYYNNTDMVANQTFVATPNFSESGDAGMPGQGVFTTDNRQEVGVDLGGFFLKDRIWFFAAYDRVTLNQEISSTSGPVEGQSFPVDTRQNKWAGKLTFNLRQSTTLVGSYFSDPQVETGAIRVPQGTNPATYDGRIDTGGTDYAARLNQLFGSAGILELQYSHHEDRYKTTPLGANAPLTIDHTPIAFGSEPDYYGGYGFVVGPLINNASTRNAYAGSFTAYVQNSEIKVGGDYQKDSTSGISYFTGGTGLAIDPCTQLEPNACDLTLAPIYTNRYGNTIPVFYEHHFLAVDPNNLTLLKRDPYNTPTDRWSAYAQDQWRATPALTVNVGVRYDSESLKRSDGVTALKLTGQWAPRVGLAWDFAGDGTSRLYVSAGRFYYSIPTDINGRIFTPQTYVVSFNYSPSFGDLDQDPYAPQGQSIFSIPIQGEALDPGIGASYQDELTVGAEKALDPTLSVGIKGTYRTLGRVIEDRCDLSRTAPPFNQCALMNPGSSGPAASGRYPTCDGSGNPTDSNRDQCFQPGIADGPAKRIFRGIEASARKQLSNSLWAQASFLYSTLRGNYSGAVQEDRGQTDPGINAAYDYYQFTSNAYGNLELDRPFQTRVDAVYNASFGVSAGLQFYVRSGTPVSRIGWFNNNYAGDLFLDPRGTVDGVEERTPTDYNMNLSLSYSLTAGPVTITPMLYLFNLFNNQTATGYDQGFNANATFVTSPTSPYYGQAGVEPGTPGPDGTICDSGRPCTDNINYGKVTARTSPRLFRMAVKITF